MKNVIGVVLAAGLGTRLRPSTDLCPKPLIPVAGVEPLFFALWKLHQLGIRRVVVNSHYLFERIQESLARWMPLLPGLEFRTSVERPEILGTGGCLLKMVRDHSDWFQNSGILLQNGDTLAQMALGNLTASPDKNTFAISFSKAHLEKYNPLWVDKHYRWQGIGKTPPTTNAIAAHFLGVHFLCAAAVAQLKGKNFGVRNTDLFNGVYRPLSNEGFEFQGLEYFGSRAGPKAKRETEFWFDMTTQEFLLEAQKEVLKTLPDSDLWPSVLKARFPDILERAPGVWISTKELKKAPHFTSPAIFVEATQTLGASNFKNFSIGPNAAFIHESGAFKTPSPERPISMQNSVVFTGNSKSGTLPEALDDTICVI